MPLFGPPNVQKLKANRDVRGLVKALGYGKDASVRRAAAVALDTLGWKPDRDEAGTLYWIEKRRWDKCAEIGTPAAKLLIAVSRDRELDPDVRVGAAEALGQIRDAQAVKPLCDVLKTDPIAQVRRAAAKSLGQIGDPQAVEPLGAALMTDNDRWVCASAAEALGQIGHARAVESLVAALDAHHLKDSYSKEDVRNTAAKALAKIGAPAVEPLIAVLRHKDASIRRAAVEALGQIGDTQAVNPLGIVLETDKDGSVRHSAVDSLGQIGGTQAAELLGVVLKVDKDAGVRMAAVNALGRIGGARAVELLGPVLTTEQHSDVRGWAVKSLGQIGGTQAVELLAAVLTTESNLYVRGYAAESLGRIGGARAVELLEVTLATEKEGIVRAKAVEALGRIGGTRAVELLGAVLADESANVGEVAASVLGQAGPACDIKLLVAGLRNRERRVRHAALYGLKRAGWEPCSEIERAACWIISGELNRLTELDRQAIYPLLVESMDWQTDPDEWYVKGWIAKLLVRPAIAADDSILARAEDQLEIYAKKCAEYLDILVKHSREILIAGCRAMFEDYADLMVKASSYQVSEIGDGAGGRIYHYEKSASLQAVMDICQITTPIATNLLHHLSKLRDTEATSSTFEVAYDSEHPSGGGAHTTMLSFEEQRSAAQKELARRGNPDYDLSAYKADDCWRIPK